MASELRFEYPIRMSEIVPRLLSDDPQERAKGILMLEQRDRHLEDNWPDTPAAAGAAYVYQRAVSGSTFANAGTATSDGYLSFSSPIDDPVCVVQYMMTMRWNNNIDDTGSEIMNVTIEPRYTIAGGGLQVFDDNRTGFNIPGTHFCDRIEYDLSPRREIPIVVAAATRVPANAGQTVGFHLRYDNHSADGVFFTADNCTVTIHPDATYPTSVSN